MRKKKLIYLIAGEASGDFLGANIIKSCKQRYQDSFEFTGIGGELMEKEGFVSLFPLSDLTHLGFFEVLSHLPLLWKRFWQTVKDIKQKKPDLLLTIDSPDFTLRVGKKVRSKSLFHVHYVAPTVWAWRPGRAKKMAQTVDHLLTLYDFEPDYFLRENLPTTFVGHPLADQIKFTPSFESQKNYIALLPGSREREITTLLPIFLESALQLKRKFEGLQYWIPTLNNRLGLVQDLVNHSPLKDQIAIVTQESQKEVYFQQSKAALAASGTVTLELALRALPTVIAYKIHPLSAFLGRWLIKTPFIGLPNIILQQPLMPEFIQANCRSSYLTSALERFIEDSTIQEIFNENRQKLLHHLKNAEDSGIIVSQIINNTLNPQ